MSKWLLAFVGISLLGQDATQIIREAQDRARSNSQKYEGTLKVIDSKSKIAEKRWQYERIGSFGESKSVLRFTAPAEVKGVALLVVNHRDRASDQWMWTPAIQRERRIALQDRSTRFFGTDFSFEDLEERDVDQYSYKLLGEESLNGTACWKLQSKRKKSSRYTSSLVWGRKENYTFALTEGFKGDKLMRRIDYSDLEKVQNIWTAKKIEVFDATRNSRTVLTLEKPQYNVSMKDEDFTLQALRRES